MGFVFYVVGNVVFCGRTFNFKIFREQMNANPSKIILHLCASEFGSDTRDYKAAGYDVRYITKEIGVENYHPPANVYGIIANPPCTMFSKARLTPKIPRDFHEGMRLVKECLRIIWECQEQIHGALVPKSPLKFWVLENPNSYLKYFLGKPAFIYEPYEFGEDKKKPTALWGYFNAPIKPLLAVGRKSKHVVGGHDRWNRTTSDNRSIASPHFTKAFFYANP